MNNALVRTRRVPSTTPEVKYIPCSCGEACDSGIRLWREGQFIRFSTVPLPMSALSSEYPLPALDEDAAKELIVKIAEQLNIHVIFRLKGLSDGNNARR